MSILTSCTTEAPAIDFLARGVKSMPSWLTPLVDVSSGSVVGKADAVFVPLERSVSMSVDGVVGPAETCTILYLLSRAFVNVGVS
jgi:hypothetical protein